MLALTEKQRKFVANLFLPGLPPRGQGRHAMAARLAGYGKPDGSSNPRTINAIAHNLVSDKKVQAAIKEYTKGAIATLAPEAVAAILEMVEDKNHKDRAKVAMSVLDRIDPAPRPPLVQIEQHTNITVSPDQMIARIRELSAKHGMDGDALLAGRLPRELLDLRAVPVPAAEETQ
jgi:hypothetical protein